MKIHVNNAWNDPQSDERMDLVFENRFKGYGAYQLRKQYNRNKVWAMIITFCLFLSLATGPLLSGKNAPPHLKKTPPKEDTTVLYTGVTDENDQDKPEKKSGGKTTTTAQGAPEFDPQMPTALELLPGEGTISPGTGDSADTPGNGTDEIPGDMGKPKVFSLKQRPDYDCVFAGGIEAFSAYIRDHYQNQELCNDGEIEGYALVQFIINVDGHISDVNIVESNKSCPEFALEIKSIIENSPNWRPASANGRLVKCLRQVPVKLKLN